MKIIEVTNAARKVIKRIANLYISYATTNSMESYNKLQDALNENINSADIDIKVNAQHYDNLLKEDLTKILTNY